MKATKELMVLEMMNIIAWYNMATNGQDEELKAKIATQISELPMNVRFKLKRNIRRLIENGAAQDYEEMQNELRSKFFDEEHSDEYEDTQKDADGNEVLDENGEPIKQSLRRLKDEYVEEYTKALQDLQKIAVKREEVALDLVDLGEIVENLPDDTSIDMDCLDMLSFMDAL